MKNRFGPIICLFYLLSMSCANANDSIARVGVGGITLLKSDHIRMVQEELEISTSKIRVHYKFFNESRNDIKTTIAFPMPPYRAQHPDSNDPYNRPLRAFTTFIDGQAVSTTLDRRATKGSVEITARLREIGLTDQQIFETFALCVAPGKEPEYCGLTPQQISLLQADKIEGWWVDETALWEYVFPANKAVDVVHEYSPNVGWGNFVPYQSGEDVTQKNETPSDGRKGISPECQGADVGAVTKRIRALAEKGAHSVIVSVQEVSYILLTGNNWKGPISEFKLRVRKDMPDQIISVCFPGKPKKIDKSTYEFTQKNFVPKDDLLVVFYTVQGTDAY